MATSGALSTSNDNIKYKITITQNSQNVGANTSNVTVSVRCYRTNTRYTTYGTGTVYCKINGTTYNASITSDDKITSGGVVLFTKTLNIAHASDGSKTLTVSAWIDHSQFDSKEQSFSMTLTTIPRATTPTINVASVDMGEDITISMPRASSSFTHTLKYSFSGTSGTIGSSLGTSKTWTVPLSLASRIPNATSGTLTITCETYNGSTKIGSKTDTVTIKVPTSVVPTISGITVTETVSGLADKFGAFVKNKSKLSATVNASGAYSSTISSYSTTFLSKTYSGKTFSVSSLTSSGSLKMVTTVKDSRGRSATYTKTITVVDYENPIINTLTAVRCDADGTLNDEGECLLIDYSYAISTVSNKNDKSYTLALISSDASTFQTVASGSEYTLDTSLIVSDGISTDQSYTVKLTVKDYFRTVTHEVEAPTAFTLIDYHSSGKGMSIGKVAEEPNLFDVGLPARFRNGLEVDTEWVSLTLNEELFAPYNANNNSLPRYKVSGGYVNIIGAVTPLANLESSAEIVILASGIPSKYRPPITLNYLCQGTGMNHWLCQVTTSGTITLSRYGMSEFATISPGNWLPFSISYAI